MLFKLNVTTTFVSCCTGYVSGNKCASLIIINISCVKLCLYILCHQTGNKCVPSLSLSICCWQWAQYAPLSAVSNWVTVCFQSGYEWEPSSLSCTCTGPSMYQLGVQRVLWHWTWLENSPLNSVSPHHEPAHVKRALLQLEQEQSGNMLMIGASCGMASVKPLLFCWSHHYVTCSWCGLYFQPLLCCCDVTCHAACVKEPCF